jgi:hypothetical protein
MKFRAEYRRLGAGRWSVVPIDRAWMAGCCPVRCCGGDDQRCTRGDEGGDRWTDGQRRKIGEGEGEGGVGEGGGGREREKRWININREGGRGMNK